MRDPSKTEPPTPQRISEAKSKGHLPKSREITSFLVLIGTLVSLWYLGKGIFGGFSEGVVSFFGRAVFEPSDDLFAMIFLLIAKILLPVLAVAAILAVVGNLIQTGPITTPNMLSPNLDKLNPMKGLKRVFSPTSLIEVAKSIVKISVAGFVVFMVLRSQSPKLSEMLGLDISGILSGAASIVFKVILYSSIMLVAVAILDYFWQRREWYYSLWMTKSEVKEEMKRYEGDPLVKSRLRRRMLQIARLRMMAEVPRADVVITNPVHIAVALKYEKGRMKAPRVVAKGMGYIAQKIKELAQQNNVIIYEDPPLAWAIFKSTEIGDFVPPSLYRAVAQVIAYVMRVKGQRAQV